MKKLIRLAVFTCAVITPIASQAVTFPVDCFGRKDTHQIFECLHSRAKAEDKILNDAYDNLIKVLRDDNAARIPLLVKAEKAWVTYRNTICDYRKSVSTDGDLAGVTDAICFIEETQRRRDQIEQEALHIFSGSIFSKSTN